MKYKVTIQGREREVDVMVTGGGSVSVSMDGTPVDADVERVPGGLSLRLDHRVYDIVVGGKPEAMHLAAREARAKAEVISERMRARAQRRGASGSAEKELRAPMPGRVVKVLVAEGDTVAEGDPCVVIEAMKMENELRAPAEAKVASVHVAEGASVESQALLVAFE